MLKRSLLLNTLLSISPLLVAHPATIYIPKATVIVDQSTQKPSTLYKWCGALGEYSKSLLAEIPAMAISGGIGAATGVASGYGISLATALLEKLNRNYAPGFSAVQDGVTIAAFLTAITIPSLQIPYAVAKAEQLNSIFRKHDININQAATIASAIAASLVATTATMAKMANFI